MKNKYPNWLVPIEITKNLKEIGFDEPCVCYTRLSYNETNTSNCVPDVSYSSFGKLDGVKNSEHINDDITFGISIPTWEQVFEWFNLRGLYETIDYEGNEVYTIRVIIKGTPSVSTDNRKYFTYGEAREVLVNELIRIYKEFIRKTFKSEYLWQNILVF